MATPPEDVRGGLEVVTAAAVTETALLAAQGTPDDLLGPLTEALPLILPAYYDAAGSLAVAWYDELRDESSPRTTFDPTIVSDANAQWIERELRADLAQLAARAEQEIEQLAADLTAEAEALVQKEVARGFRDTIDGNSRRDPEAIGWSRHAKEGACRFCRMLARDAAVYKREETARFAAHTTCHCVARPEFANGEHGPEADVYQYLASQRTRTPEERRKLREYLDAKYGPDSGGSGGSRGQRRREVPTTRDIDAARSLEELRGTLATLERSALTFETPATRARIDELRRKIRERGA